MNKKFFSGAALTICSLLFITACGTIDYPTDEELAAMSQEFQAEREAEQAEAEKPQRVGNEFCGYITLTNEWSLSEYYEEDELFLVYVFGDETVYMDSSYDEMTADDWDNIVEMTTYDLESEGAVDIKYSETTLDGTPALYFTGNFPETSEYAKTYFHKWVLLTGDNVLHSVESWNTSRFTSGEAKYGEDYIPESFSFEQ